MRDRGVEVIDLVEASSSDEDNNDSKRRREFVIFSSNNDSVRQHNDSTNIINLVSDDEEDGSISDDSDLAINTQPEISTSPNGTNSTNDNCGSRSTSSSLPETIITSSINPMSEIEAVKEKPIFTRKLKVKLEFEPKEFGEANIGDEVIEVIDPNAMEEEDETEGGSAGVQGSHKKKRNYSAAFAAPEGDDDEIEFVGGNMTVAADLPHPREACPKYAFKYNQLVRAGGGMEGNPNKQYCANCFCFVCEVKAGECMDWESHYPANCRESKWKIMRDSTNTPLLKLMTPSQKALFSKRFAQLSGGCGGGVRSGYDSDDYDDEYYEDLFGEFDDDENSYDSNEGVFERYVNNTVSSGNKIVDIVNEVTTRLSIFPIPLDDYMECSGLIIWIISNIYNQYKEFMNVILLWTLHFDYQTKELRDIMVKEIENAKSFPFNYRIVALDWISFIPRFVETPIQSMMEKLQLSHLDTNVPILYRCIFYSRITIRLIEKKTITQENVAIMKSFLFGRLDTKYDDNALFEIFCIVFSHLPPSSLNNDVVYQYIRKNLLEEFVKIILTTPNIIKISSDLVNQFLAKLANSGKKQSSDQNDGNQVEKLYRCYWNSKYEIIACVIDKLSMASHTNATTTTTTSSSSANATRTITAATAAVVDLQTKVIM